VPASALAATPGSPCWTDVNPYPFGFDGTPVNTDSQACQSWAVEHNNNPAACYLSVDSMAFRAWNRGIAVLSPPPNSGLSTTAFGVWLYNGNRWFPDPTFPGQSVCKGSTVLWAGKLDYWLVGQLGTAQTWPALCRFDGVNFSWEPVPVPAAALADVPVDPTTGKPAAGAIQAGACFAWNDCWFFGSYGVVLRWDGQRLSSWTTGLGSSPWLTSDFTAAVTGTDPAGNPYAFALAGTSSGANTTPGAQALGQATSAAPDGSPPPQLYRSGGGAFEPLRYSPPTTALPGDPHQTDLAAVALNSQGQGWVAGDPRGLRPGDNRPSTTKLSPLVPLSTTGASQPCPGTPANGFADSPSGGYLWASLGVLPNGDGLAGGWDDTSNGSGAIPVLADVSCDRAPALLYFGTADPSTGTIAAADPSGWITAIAVNAVNDAWAVATSSQPPQALPDNTITVPPPHLYHLTDSTPPLAPTGNDVEPRPLVTQSEPTIFVFGPSVLIPPPPPPIITKKKAKPVHRPSPIYAVQRPALVRGPGGALSLVIRFKVRSTVTIGIEAFHRGQLVSSSGMKTFRGSTGELVLKVDRNRWPTRLKFVTPKANPGKKK
jgi:hypothetical protein